MRMNFLMIKISIMIIPLIMLINYSGFTLMSIFTTLFIGLLLLMMIMITTLMTMKMTISKMMITNKC